MMSPLAAPWLQVAVHPIGGLLQVGYGEGSDLLLVVSSDGRGVFDCQTGQKIAHDRSDASTFFDPVQLMVDGIGPLAGQSIRTAGLHGGSLLSTTSDGWTLETQIGRRSIRRVILSGPSDFQPTCVGDDAVCELRAFGFSETGKSFVIATTADLTICTRLAESAPFC
jgi:hypothetical protein